MGDLDCYARAGEAMKQNHCFADLVNHFGSTRNAQVAMARNFLYGECPSLPDGYDWNEVMQNYHQNNLTLSYAIGQLTEQLKAQLS